MYFYRSKGKQVLDLRGDLVLTHNTDLILARSKSAAPSAVHNGRYVVGATHLTPWQKLRATVIAVRFIWGESTALTPEAIDEIQGEKCRDS